MSICKQKTNNTGCGEAHDVSVHCSQSRVTIGHMSSCDSYLAENVGKLFLVATNFATKDELLIVRVRPALQVLLNLSLQVIQRFRQRKCKLQCFALVDISHDNPHNRIHFSKRKNNGLDSVQE